LRATKTKSAPSISDQREHDPAQSAGSGAPRKRNKRFGPKPEFISVAKEMCELGGTNANLAIAFGVSLGTITLWQSTSKEFAEACRIGMDAAAHRVERALYERAVGYIYKADTVVRHRGGISIVQRNVHVAADPRAAKIWLERREAGLALVRESPFRQLARELMGTALRPKPQQ
jgi:hypothetical protein